jgi:hypothetical protein
LLVTKSLGKDFGMFEKKRVFHQGQNLAEEGDWLLIELLGVANVG